MIDFEAELAELIREEKWICKVYFSGREVVGRLVSLSFPEPSDLPKHLQHFVGKSIHVGLLLAQYEDSLPSDAILDLHNIFLRAGNDETKDGWRHSFDPVTGKFYRNNVYGEAA